MSLRTTMVTLVVGAVAALAAAPASAQLQIERFDGEVIDRDQAGNAVPATQAGGHPYEASTTIELSRHLDSSGSWAPDASVKDLRVELPLGLVGNPLGLSRCTEELLNSPAVYTYCPPESQIGVATVDFGGGVGPIDHPLFNMVPTPGAPAVFGFKAGGVPPVHLRARVRPGDNGLAIDSLDINQALPVLGASVTIWGVPADPSHDPMRVCAFGAGFGCASNGSLQPVLTNPTSCVGPVETRLSSTGWDGSSDSASFFSHLPAPDDDVLVGLEGCERLPFDPSIDVRADTTSPDSPTSVRVRLTFPQEGLQNPDGLATAHLKRAKVTLPEGMTINPASADGLQACTDAQLKLKTDEPIACPEGSKLGTVSAKTPLLEDPLRGGVYLRTQNSSDPESGEMFRLALVVASEERGVSIRLPGQIRANKDTGRLEAIFDDNPQLPVDEVDVTFKGGSRAPLATPPTCGTKTVDAELTSWAGGTVTRHSSFTIDCPPGLGGFAPALDAGTTNPFGGTFSPLLVRIARADRDQYLSGVSLETPEGLLAKLKGVSLCRSAQAINGGCPAGSRIGTATVGAGSGPNPFYVAGDVYLTESYKGGPYGLAVHVHAKAGPYDLGWVRVRQAIHVDRTTAELTAVSDPLPQIVGGVPVRLRSVNVDVDRAGFTVNPTSCDEKRIGATLTSIDGAVSRVSARFQVGDCSALPFKPKLAMRLTGKRQTRTGSHPGVKAVVTQASGQAGIARAEVRLPKALALDPDNAQALCEFEDGTKPDLERHCPKGSIVGRARAVSPLLNRPLMGDVYFVKNVRIDKKSGNRIRTLPMIVVALRGEVAINLKGASSTAKDGRLVSTFTTVPDAPISRFNLNIAGGKTGILAVTATRRGNIDICRGSQVARAAMTGQNGKRRNFTTPVKTPCAKKGSPRRKR